ncbi:NADP-dependent oxidoreductase [uncultured Bartonella sp.]|uniref:NADP-dependent oxidoreductase n=1 Tax=uncultured Bartonella sp. TaxID=104108 RepID=UPI002612A8E3|nr:NADP-dependent oxidoreductase [uncultured Bartonella sp.]
MEDIRSTRIVLASRPDGMPVKENFSFETVELPELKSGEVLIKICYLSLDPYMRGRMDDAPSYDKPLSVGDVMVGGTVGEIVASRHPDFKKGDKVLSYSGWQSYSIENGVHIENLNHFQAPLTTALGILGMPGFTAYAGMRNIGKPKKGETVVVAAATGTVGTMVGQLAKIAGAKAVGIAGGVEKCAFGRDVLGFDLMIDHKSPDFAEHLAKSCPEGIDVYYENVGGAVWDAVFPLLNRCARIPVCGLIAQYNGVEPVRHSVDRLPELMRTILVKSLLIRGFLEREFANQKSEFIVQAQEWLKAGRLHYREDIVDGLENAPEAFIGLLQGKNFGKLIIRL